MLDPGARRRRIRITLGIVVAALPWVAVAIPESETVVVVLFFLLTFPISIVVRVGPFERAPSFDDFWVALLSMDWTFWIPVVVLGLLLWLNIQCLAAVLLILGRRWRRSREPGVHRFDPILPPTDGQYFEGPEAQRFRRDS